MPKDLPIYHKNKMKGNTGESIVQYFLSKFALVHKIDGAYDIGNDFICELIKDQYPTNLLFYVQVKYTKDEPNISGKTLNYWKGSPIPVYLFWVKDTNLQQSLSQIQNPEVLFPGMAYKRCTPFLHKNEQQNTEEFNIYSKVSFLRHLLIDYSRTQYIKGSTPILHPRDFLTIDDKLGMELPGYQLFIKDVIPEYSDKILKNGWINLFSLATILSKKEDVKNKKISLEIANIALKLVTKKDEKNYSLIIDNLKSLITKLTKYKQ